MAARTKQSKTKGAAVELDNGWTVTPVENGGAPLKGHEPHPSIVEANRDAMLDEVGPTDPEASRTGNAEKALPKYQALVGFMAVDATGGVRETPFGARGVFFPIVPGFDHQEPQADLKARLAKGPQWKGFALMLEDGALTAHPWPLDQPTAPRG